MNRASSILIVCSLLLLSLANSCGNCYEVVNEDVKTFLAKLEDAIYKMNTYSYVLDSNNWKGKKHEAKITKFSFKKPNLMRTEVIEGHNKGSIVVLNKKDIIRAKNKMGMRATLKPTDSRLKNIRGATFMQSSLVDILHRLKDHIMERGCNATVTEYTHEGRPAYLLHIEHKDEDDPVTVEDVWFDKSTLFIIKKIKYEGSQKVTDLICRDININVQLDDALFEQ